MDESKHLRLDSCTPADAAVVCVCMNHLNIKLSRNLAHIRSFRPINLPLLLGSPLVVSSNVNLTPFPPCLLHFVTRDRRRRVLACVPLCRCIIRESICAPFHPKKKPIFFFNICLFLGHSRRRRMAARFSRLTQQINRRENRRKTLATES